jgi:SAM-dependent methyltransferase
LPFIDNLSLVDEIAQIVVSNISERSLQKRFPKYVKDHRARIARDVQYVRDLVKKSDRILEIGSSPLLLTGSLKMLGYQIQGLDIWPERTASAARELRLRMVKSNIETDPLPFKDGIFDVVIFNEVFEHLRIDLIFTMGQIHRVLCPKGLLLMSTPNLKSLRGVVNFLLFDKAASLNTAIYPAYESVTKYGVMGHVREYTPTEVADFLEDVGFAVSEIIFRGTYGSHRYSWKRILNIAESTAETAYVICC